MSQIVTALLGRKDEPHRRGRGVLPLSLSAPRFTMHDIQLGHSPRALGNPRLVRIAELRCDSMATLTGADRMGARAIHRAGVVVARVAEQKVPASAAKF